MDDTITHIFDKMYEDYITKDVALEQAIATEDDETIQAIKKFLSIE